MLLSWPVLTNPLTCGQYHTYLIKTVFSHDFSLFGAVCFRKLSVVEKGSFFQNSQQAKNSSHSNKFCVTMESLSYLESFKISSIVPMATTPL